MSVYYADDLVTLLHGDSRELAIGLPAPRLIVTDPPYNIGFDYRSYNDRLARRDYADLLRQTIQPPAVVIHYPEAMFELAAILHEVPTKVVAWVYNANTARQWRSVAWFGIHPNLSRVRQPYKNPTDRRVAALIEAGAEGTAVYDWWHIDQVKNVSAEKTEHPCPIPLELARRILLVTPSEDTVVDPFAGSGTILRAAKDLGRKSVGVEMDAFYCKIAAQRCGQEVLGLV